jgi:hypothetical protein
MVSFASSTTAKGNLPTLPPSSSPTRSTHGRDQQATVRHTPSNGSDDDHATPRRGAARREPSDEIYYEEEDDQDPYLDRHYVPQSQHVQRGSGPQKQQPHHPPTPPPQLEDDLPDTTMLDSIILPAIASVRFFFSRIYACGIIMLMLDVAFPPGVDARSPRRAQRASACLCRGRADHPWCHDGVRQ